MIPLSQLKYRRSQGAPALGAAQHLLLAMEATTTLWTELPQLYDGSKQ